MSPSCLGGWGASCLTSAGKVALAGLTGTTLGVASVTKCLDKGFKGEICIKEVRFNFAKPTVIAHLIITVMNNHAGSTLTRPVGKPFSYINAR